MLTDEQIECYRERNSITHWAQAGCLVEQSSSLCGKDYGRCSAWRNCVMERMCRPATARWRRRRTQGKRHHERFVSCAGQRSRTAHDRSSPAGPNLGAPDWRGDVPGKPMTVRKSRMYCLAGITARTESRAALRRCEYGDKLYEVADCRLNYHFETRTVCHEAGHLLQRMLPAGNSGGCLLRVSSYLRLLVSAGEPRLSSRGCRSGTVDEFPEGETRLATFRNPST